MSKDDYLELSEQVDELGNKYSTNSKTNGRFHTDWLNMMYPRLKVARQLLKEDGVIFISIDDNEYSRLKMICDEIFGEHNFIANLIWHARRGGGNDAKNVAVDHEYILVYSKNRLICKLIGKVKSSDDFKFEDEYKSERGKYNLQQFDRASLTYTPSLDYPIEAPDGTYIYPGHVTKDEWLKRRENLAKRNDWCWMMSETTFINAKNMGFIKFEKNKNDTWNVKVKTYQFVNYKNPNTKLDRYLKLRSILNNDFGNTRNGNDDIDLLGLKTIFSYPKPVDLIKNLFKYFYDKNSLILDFFAGSGTTGQAVMELNKEDGGNRKYILVQIPEKIENNGDFKTISDITAERIKRSIEKYNYKENGYKYFRLTESNFNKWNNSFINQNNLNQIDLNSYLETINKSSTNQDIIYEILLKTGRLLDTKLTRVLLNDNTELYINEDKTLIFALDNPSIQNLISFIKEIWKENKQYNTLEIYIKEEYMDDYQKLNFIEQIKQLEKSKNIIINTL